MQALLLLASWTPLVLLAGSSPTWGAMLGLLNALAACVFGWDKAQAQLGTARVSENVLHIASMLGAAGATAGRLVFRHKTLHPSFSASAGAGAALLWALLWVVNRASL